MKLHGQWHQYSDEQPSFYVYVMHKNGCVYVQGIDGTVYCAVEIDNYLVVIDNPVDMEFILHGSRNAIVITGSKACEIVGNYARNLITWQDAAIQLSAI